MSIEIAVNPPSTEIGRANVIYSGTARAHWLPPMRGSLSIKIVSGGAATWESEGRRFVVRDGAWLLLGDDREYSLHIESARPVTTFCLFFRRGFLEDALRAATTSQTLLLASPFETPPAELRSALHPHDEALQSLLDAMQQQRATEEHFAHAAALIARNRAPREDGIRSAKASTRDELRRRVQRGTDYLLSHLDEDVTIKAAAREACLSLFHFHRAFAALHGVTPYQFVVRERLALAARLLQRTTHDVAEIAASAGFASATSFTTRFARAYGIPPAAFRRRR